MPATKVSDLLPISENDQHPHAYQVFGLEVGEQDRDTVKSAIFATAKRLKDQKSSADPIAWKQAVSLVKQAEAILSDPAKRAELDALFGIVNIPDAASAATSWDPLAAVLPSADPLADILPPTSPISSSSRSIPPPAPAAIPQTASMAGAAAVAQPSFPSNIAIKGTTPYRRRRSKTNWFLVMLTIGMFAIIGLLGYFVFFGPGNIEITSQDGQLTIRKGSASAQDKIAETKPVPIRDTKRDRDDFDSVLRKTLGNATDLDSNEDHSGDLTKLGKAGDPIAGLPPELQKLLDENQDAERPDMTDSPPVADDVSETTPEMTPSTDEPTTMMKVEPPSESGQVEISDEVVAATNKKIEQLRALIRDAKWKQITQAALDLKESVLTDEQRIEVESLYELADLATYYYGAIERGILSRQPAETIEVTDSLTIVIVEVGENLFVIRYAGRNKTYKFDELPLVLAHRMAELTLPIDKTTNLAAKACFQALAPKSNSEYRKESIDWLQSIDGEVPGAHPKQLAETIKQLFR